MKKYSYFYLICMVKEISSDSAWAVFLMTGPFLQTEISQGLHKRHVMCALNLQASQCQKSFDELTSKGFPVSLRSVNDKTSLHYKQILLLS